MNQTYISSCQYDPENNPLCPIFRLGDIVERSGLKFSEIARVVRFYLSHDGKYAPTDTGTCGNTFALHTHPNIHAHTRTDSRSCFFTCTSSSHLNSHCLIHAHKYQNVFNYTITSSTFNFLVVRIILHKAIKIQYTPQVKSLGSHTHPLVIFFHILDL